MMNFTGGEIAALIAALSFALIAIALCYFLFKATSVVTELNTTIEEVNMSLSTITKDADHLLIEVEGLLNKTNTTLDDVNGKLGLTDPLFQAVGDLGESVSGLNDTTVQLTKSLVGKKSRLV